MAEQNTEKAQENLKPTTDEDWAETKKALGYSGPATTIEPWSDQRVISHAIDLAIQFIETVRDDFRKGEAKVSGRIQAQGYDTLNQLHHARERALSAPEEVPGGETADLQDSLDAADEMLAVQQAADYPDNRPLSPNGLDFMNFGQLKTLRRYAQSAKLPDVVLLKKEALAALSGQLDEKEPAWQKELSRMYDGGVIDTIDHLATQGWLKGDGLDALLEKVPKIHSYTLSFDRTTQAYRFKIYHGSVVSLADIGHGPTPTAAIQEALKKGAK